MEPGILTFETLVFVGPIVGLETCMQIVAVQDHRNHLPGRPRMRFRERGTGIGTKHNDEK